jgi:hypothetical protein
MSPMVPRADSMRRRVKARRARLGACPAELYVRPGSGCYPFAPGQVKGSQQKGTVQERIVSKNVPELTP